MGGQSGRGGIASFLPSFGTPTASEEARKKKAEVLQKAAQERLAQGTSDVDTSEDRKGLASLEAGIEQLKVRMILHHSLKNGMAVFFVQAMGYEEQEASRVLMRVEGDVERAIRVLESNSK